MKIAIIQEAGIHNENKHLRECLCLKRAFMRHPDVDDVTVWGRGHRNFRDKIDWNSFDIIVNIENYSHAWMPDVSKTTKPMKFVWSIDSHVMDVYPHKKVFDAGNYHWFLQATSIFCDRVPNSIWFPNAYDDESFVYQPDKPKISKKPTLLGFCGSKLNRGDLCEKLAKKTSFSADYWRLGNDMIRLVRSYKIHLNLNMNWDVNYRNFETCGLGTVLLTNNDMNPRDYHHLGFRNEENCLFWNSKRKENHVLEILNRYKDDDDSLKKIGESGHNLVFKHHTYYNRICEILDIYSTGKPLDDEREYK